MECNREEALRAKEMAEQKVASEDYITAKRLAMKAQSLYPSLENIAQVIAVIDVHISAQVRISSEDKDWYSILQVEPTADDTTLKKQYRKLALWLHPDKNKSTGAESAFKLIGEAFQVLSDKTKRKTFDSRRVLFYKKSSTNCAPLRNQKTSATNGNQKQPCNTTAHRKAVNTTDHQGPDPFKESKQQYAHVFNQQPPNIFNQQQPNVFNQQQPNNFNQQQSNNFNKPSQQQPHVSHQQHPNMFKKQTYQQSFVYDKSMQHDTSWCSQTQAENAQHPQFSPFTFWTMCSWCHIRYQYFRKYENQNLLCHQCKKPFIAKDISISHLQRNSKMPSFSKTCQSMFNYSVNVGDGSGFKVPNIPINTSKTNSVPSSCGSVNQPNVSVTSSISSKGSGVSSNPLKGGMQDDLHKRNISDTANKLDKENDDACKMLEECLKAMLMQENCKEVAQKFDELKKSKELLTSDFVFKKSEEYFKSICNQKEELFEGKNTVIEELIKKIEEFQTAVKNGAAEKNEASNCSYLRPSQREDIAKKVEQYQKWMMDMKAAGEKDQVYKSKATSNASDMKTHDDQVNISKNANSVSSDKKKDVPKAPANTKKKRGRKKRYCTSSESEDNNNESWEKSTSSAKVENLKTYPKRTSQSKKKVRYGCIESDDDFQDGPPSKKAKAENMGTECTKTNFVETKKLADLAKNAIWMGLNSQKICEKTDGSSPPLVIQSDAPVECKIVDGDKGQFDCAVPDAEFHNFDESRDENDVQAGQVWALYDDKDGMPKYYMKVKDVKSRSPFKVQITWYELWKPSDELDELMEADISIGCGLFKTSSTQVMTNVNSFSHLVNWEKGSKGTIKIYPKKGEIWAIYQQWEQDQRVVKLCETPFQYDMVEVLTNCNDTTGNSVMPLEKVQGFKTVYCHSNREALKIPFSEVMRFSHQVPAYKLKGDESPGIPDCSWELDPAAIPLS